MTPTKRCVCPSPSAGAYSVCRRCGGEYGCTPPKKRTHGQCTCYPLAGEGKHLPDCPALYPLQPQPGDEPSALTHLTKLTRDDTCLGWGLSAMQQEQALALISEAAEERKALEAAHRAAEARFDACDKERVAALGQVEELKAGQRSASEARRQAFLELAEDLMEQSVEERERTIRRIIDNTYSPA